MRTGFKANIPPLNRAGGGTFVTTYPHGAGLLGIAEVTLTSNAATTWAYGAIGTLIATAAADTWVEGLIISQPSTAAKEWCVALTAAAAITAAAQIEAEVPMYLGVATDEIFVKVDPPAFFAAGAAINAAVAGAVKNKTVDIYAIVSINR